MTSEPSAHEPSSGGFCAIVGSTRRSDGLPSVAPLMCWGRGPDARQLSSTSSQPVLDVDPGQHHGCALLADGSVSCWGTDPDGLGLLEGPP